LCLSIAHVMNLGWVFYCIPVLFLAGWTERWIWDNRFNS
jgi:hypothetical protein